MFVGKTIAPAVGSVGTMRKIVLACAVSMVAGIVVACSEDETSTSPPGSTDAGGGSDTGNGNDASSGSDAAGNGDSSSTDASDGEAGGGTCQPATDLAAAASGKANAVAKITNASGDFSGNSTDYAAVENTGTATTGGGFSNWTTNGKFDATRRSVFIVLNTETPVTCMTYATPTPATLRYSEGSPAAAQWNCTGSVIVDEVSGKSVKYHFNGACSPLAAGGGSAAGTFTLDGHGTATTLP